MAGGRATPHESRPGPGPNRLDVGAEGPLARADPQQRLPPSVGGSARRGAGPSVVGDDDESSEASEVTMRSEEDEAAADGGAEAVVRSSRSYLASNAPIVCIQGPHEWRGIRRRKKGFRAQDASSRLGSTRAPARGIRRQPLHALAIGQGWIGLQANAARRRDTSCLPLSRDC